MICLNKNLQLTHGNPIGPAALTARFSTGVESFTAVVENADSRPSWFCQAVHQVGEKSAHLTFLVGQNLLDDQGLPALWDSLCTQSGEMGAVNVLVELEESSHLFESLRRAGFTAYGWEAAWRLPNSLESGRATDTFWKIAQTADDSACKSLYQSLVPPIVQAAEGIPNGSSRRLVYRNENELLAFVESANGPRGIYLKPLIHPAVTDLQNLLSDLAAQFSGLGQPVYLQVRSYQAWLLDALNALGAETSEHFNLLVKHLAILQRNGVTVSQRQLKENRQIEPSAPIVQNILPVKSTRKP